jgi:hypothetical protein
MNKPSFAAAARGFISPMVLAGATVVGTLCMSSVAWAWGHGGHASIAENGLSGPTSLPTKPHSVMDSPSAGTIGMRHSPAASVMGASRHAAPGGHAGMNMKVGGGVHAGRTALPGRPTFEATPHARIR